MGFRRYLDAREILEMGLLRRGGARGPAHPVMAHHTAVGKVPWKGFGAVNLALVYVVTLIIRCL